MLGQWSSSWSCVCGAILYVDLPVRHRPSGHLASRCSGLILAVLVLIYGFITRKTVIGRHIYAVGGNRHAAELSGVNSPRRSTSWS